MYIHKSLLLALWLSRSTLLPSHYTPPAPDSTTARSHNLVIAICTHLTRPQVIASASYDTHIHLAYDDPDSDWQVYQKLHPKLPPTPLLLPPNASPALISALTPNDLDKAVEELNIPVLEEGETVWCLAFSGDGNILASGGDLGGIRLWSRRSVSVNTLSERC
jgi:WD40 repeat protein